MERLLYFKLRTVATRMNYIFPGSKFLENAADPLFLVDHSGVLVWTNEASRKFFSNHFKKLDFGDAPDSTPASPIKLSLLMDPVSVQAILSCRHHLIQAVKLNTPDPGLKAPLTAVVTEVSGPDPGEVHWLVALQATDSRLSRLTKRELLLATIAHDLKNPIGAIFGYADALLDTKAGQDLSARQRSVISQIRGCSARAIELVRNYQLLAQLHEVGLKPALTPSSLHDVIRAVVEQTWRDEKRSPTLTLLLAKEPLFVLVERVHLERVVANLFTNALKYTPASESITIRTNKVNDRVIFEVANSGVTIDQQEIDSIFDRYTRARSSRGSPGTGLGLYIVKEIVTAVGGQVEVACSKESGTCFSVNLPSA